jgi:hypothetical protein
MGFLSNRTKAGNTLLDDGKGGTLRVIIGKAKAKTVKAKKDNGTIKKGDDIHGVEFVFELADSGNIKGQIYQQAQGDEKYGKYIPDPEPLVFPLKCSFFLDGDCATAYLKLFENTDKLGLPEGLIGGFKGDMTIGENKYVTQLLNNDFNKPDGILGMLLDNVEKVSCPLDFPVPIVGSYGGGAKSQTESERLADCIKFIEAVLTDASPEQVVYVKLAALHEGLTIVNFLELML